MKNTAILLCGVPLMLMAGCSTSFTKVRSAINEAPDWYAERRVQIRGEGYPDIADIPAATPAAQPVKTLSASGDALAGLQQQFFSDPRAEVGAGAEGIAKVGAELRAEFEPGLPEAEFLSESEIAAIRASFNVPRVTEGLYQP